MINTKMNERITITLSKRQVKWLKDTSKRIGVSVSHLMSWLMDRNPQRIANYLFEKTNFTDEQIMEIIRTPWLIDK